MILWWSVWGWRVDEHSRWSLLSSGGWIGSAGPLRRSDPSAPSAPHPCLHTPVSRVSPGPPRPGRWSRRRPTRPSWRAARAPSRTRDCYSESLLPTESTQASFVSSHSSWPFGAFGGGEPQSFTPSEGGLGGERKDNDPPPTRSHPMRREVTRSHPMRREVTRSHPMRREVTRSCGYKSRHRCSGAERQHKCFLFS